MTRAGSKESPTITMEMTILDVVSQYPGTEAVFKRYDQPAGVCLCCRALFEPLKDAARKYGLDLTTLIADLTPAASNKIGDAGESRSR